MGQGGQQVQLQGSSDMSQLQVKIIVLCTLKKYCEQIGEILVKEILPYLKQYATPLQSETHHLLDLVTFVITDLYLRSISLCKPLLPRLCF